MNFNKRICFLLTLFVLHGVTHETFAQRKQKDKKEEGVKSNEYIEQEAEYYFTEGEKQYILEDYAKAVNSFRSSLQLIPDNDVAYFKLAQIYNKTNQIDAAKLSIEKALELNRENAYYFLLAADIYTNSNDLEKATQFYEELLETIPGEEHNLFQLGAIYLYLKEYQKALDTYDRAESYFGINEQASVQKQKIYLKQNKVDEAIAEGEKLMDAYPGNPKYVLMLAEMFSSNSKDEEAIHLVDSMLATNPDVAGAHLFLADIYRKQRKLDEFEKELLKGFDNPAVVINAKINAVMKYMALLPDERLEAIIPILCDKIMSVHPDDPNGYLLTGDVYSTLVQKQYITQDSEDVYKEKAVDAYAKYVHYDASKFNVWQNLLNLEIQIDRTDSTILHSEQALEVFPNQAWLYLVAGVANLQKELWDEAVFYFEEGIKRASSNDQLLELLYGYLGDTYNSLEEHDKSDEAYEHALEINPNNELVLNNYSYFLSLRGKNLQKAKEMSTKLMRLNSENLAYLDTYAWVQYKLGFYEEARRVLEKVVADKAANAENFDHFGDVLYRLGDIKNAKIQWQKAREMDKTIENIDKKIEQGKIIQ